MVNLQIENEVRMDLPFDYNYEPEAHAKPEHKEVRTGTVLEAKTPHIVKHRDGSARVMQKLKVAYGGKVFWIERELVACHASQVQNEYRLIMQGFKN